MVTLIDVIDIKPHPMNPRKNLGDLTELTESIQTFGVLQNLTVVPEDPDWDKKEVDPKFIVICGHRRLQAAKDAGVRQVPCSIVEGMDEKTQISTMLMENMQRSDLTAQEEAQGFQMMLDMGGSIREIVEKTGLSETKVRHRIKLNELDQELLEKKMAGEISINDLIKLEVLKDPENKNKALEKIGTNNFEWTVNSLHTEEVKQYVTERLADLMPDVERTGNWSSYPAICSISYEDAAEDERLDNFVNQLIEKAEEAGCEIQIHLGYNEINGRIKVDPSREERKKDPEVVRREREQAARKSKLKSMAERIEKRTTEFIRKITEEKAKKLADKTMKYVAYYIVRGYNGPGEEEVMELMDKKPDLKADMQYRERIEAIVEAYKKVCEDEPYRVLLINTFLTMAPNEWNTWLYDGRYDKEEGEYAVEAYELLEEIGYEAADEELDFINGRSDLYLKEETSK